MRVNYVLIDYENVQPEALSQLSIENFKVFVFVGSNQTKVTFEAAAALQKMGDKAEYIKIEGNGPNALDFHIAFYIGQLSASDQTAYFHIISKDTGFDPLIRHLKAKKIFSARWCDVSDIPLVKVANTKSPDERLAVVVAKLQQLGTSRPRTVKTLLSTIGAIFQKQLTEVELDSLLQCLKAKGNVVVNDTKVTYELPSD